MEQQNATRKVMQATMHVDASPDRVFPLLCPVREHDWIPGWEARIVHTASGVAEEGCVFTTTDGDGRESVWTVSRYQPCARIEFVVVLAGLYVTQLRIELRRAAGATALDWRRTYTALSPDGLRDVEAITEAGFTANVARLEALLGHYLRTGSALRL